MHSQREPGGEPMNGYQQGCGRQSVHPFAIMTRQLISLSQLRGHLPSFAAENPWGDVDSDYFKKTVLSQLPAF
jgi:hypothetical protein